MSAQIIHVQFRKPAKARAAAVPAETRMLGLVLVAGLLAYGALFVWAAKRVLEALV